MQILFDASRLIERSHKAAPTGIDRVDIAYASFLSHAKTPAFFVVGKSFPRIMPIKSANFLHRTVPELAAPSNDETCQLVYAEICGLLARPATAWPPAAGAQKFSAEPKFGFSLAQHLSKQLGKRAESGALPKRFRNAIYLHTSHSGLENPTGIHRLQSRGARVVVMVHDLIPIDYPEFCRPGEDLRHERRLLTVQQRADFILVNSAYTHQRLLSWGEQRKLTLPPIRMVPLGVAPHYFTRNAFSPPHALRPYFVSVGTIEPRKNHAFLLKLWRRLAEEMGESCPALIVIGHRGWEMEAVVDLLERSPPLSRNVIEVSGLNDHAVASLMVGARGVIQPSIVEGFSLPVAEAKAIGAPVLASDIDAHRELANELTTLIDPYDGLGWLEAVRGLLAMPRPSMTPRLETWAQVDHVKSAMFEIERFFKK